VDELRRRIIEEWERLDQRVIEQHSQTVASTSSFLCGAKGGHFGHCRRRTSYRKLYVVTNSFCVNDHFGRLSVILIEIFLVISACSLDVLENLRISEIDREQLKNQQHLFHNHNEQ